MRLAESYHLMFETGSHSLARQAAIHRPTPGEYTGKSSALSGIAACGIGTRPLLSPTRPHSGWPDLSGSAVARAISEAPTPDLDIRFHVADIARSEQHFWKAASMRSWPETMPCLIFIATRS